MTRPPVTIAVIGAGIVGLSAAWFLQERGAQVTVCERATVAAGASWGNAGWITPSLAAPLPEPALARATARMLLGRGSPVALPLQADPGLAVFLYRFARRCTKRNWRSGLAALAGLSRRALPAFDTLAAGGVTVRTAEADPLLACWRSPAGRRAVAEELRQARADFEFLDGAAVQRAEPALSGGGHGMWGVTLGPVSGQLLAEAVTSENAPAELVPFDPLRRPG